MNELKPYQVRVIEEHKARAEELKRLQEFTHTQTYEELPIVEKTLLIKQCTAMSNFVEVLRERVNYFKGR